MPSATGNSLRFIFTGKLEKKPLVLFWATFSLVLAAFYAFTGILRFHNHKIAIDKYNLELARYEQEAKAYSDRQSEFQAQLDNRKAFCEGLKTAAEKTPDLMNINSMKAYSDANSKYIASGCLGFNPDLIRMVRERDDPRPTKPVPPDF